MTVVEHRQGEFLVSTDPRKLDLDVVHAYLIGAYWCEGIPREIVERSVKHSLCFGVYHDQAGQVGFARAISDFATYAYLADVFVLEGYRGRGLSKFLMTTILAHPDLQGLRHWSLATRDAHGLYRQYGFKELARPEGYMEINVRDIYKPAV